MVNSSIIWYFCCWIWLLRF